MRLLLVKTSSMGDVAHALPVVDDILRHRPHAQIDWLVEPAFSALPQLCHGIHQVHLLPWRRWRKQLHKAQTWTAMRQLRQTLRERSYDAAIDLQGLVKSAFWASGTKAPVWGYDAASARESLATQFYARKVTVSRQHQAVDRCRELVAGLLGYETPTTTPVFGLTPPVLSGDVFPESIFNAPYAVLVPNASRPEKLWPHEDWCKVGQHLLAQGYTPVVLWGSPSEQANAELIARECGGWVPPFLKVAQVCGLMARAQLVVGLDTGFTHIAAALGCSVVGIYCDHPPELAGLTGNGTLISLGGKGRSPSLAAVLDATRTLQSSSIR
jgi:heptosyltransferase-1